MPDANSGLRTSACGHRSERSASLTATANSSCESAAAGSTGWLTGSPNSRAAVRSSHSATPNPASIVREGYVADGVDLIVGVVQVKKVPVVEERLLGRAR
jgi:hypothetical protein